MVKKNDFGHTPMATEIVKRKQLEIGSPNGGNTPPIFSPRSINKKGHRRSNT